MTSSSAAASPHLHMSTTNPTSTITTKSHHPSARSAPTSSSISPRGSGTGGGTNQACAACKYQRRKCNPDCPLAPYFPADQQRRFLNAHRLFGVSNILKTLRCLKPELCDDAMHTLIYQAEMRAMDPVGGCCRIILDLERQHELDTAELSTVLHHLALCRQAAGVEALPASVVDDPCGDLEVTSSNQQSLLFNTDQEVVDAHYINQQADAAILHDKHDSPQDHGEQQQQVYDYFYYETTAGEGEDTSNKPSVDINVDAMQHFDYDTSSATDHKVELTQAPTPVLSSGLGHQLDEHYQIDQKEYEMKIASLVDVFDMRQELQVVDVNADIDVKAEVHEEEEVAKDTALGETAQMAESSHCRLGLGFSSF